MWRNYSEGKNGLSLEPLEPGGSNSQNNLILYVHLRGVNIKKMWDKKNKMVDCIGWFKMDWPSGPIVQ